MKYKLIDDIDDSLVPAWRIHDRSCWGCCFYDSKIGCAQPVKMMNKYNCMSDGMFRIFVVDGLVVPNNTRII